MVAAPHDLYPYVATRPIKVNGALAYDVGDLVPAGAVEELGLNVTDDLAERAVPAEDTAEQTPAVKNRPRPRGKADATEDTSAGE
jgi:hypothetical protein